MRPPETENTTIQSCAYGTDFDQHYATARQTRKLEAYECDTEAGTIDINDPVWGKEHIGSEPGDALLVELYRHPVFQRLAGIEQLTLPEMYATMPGSTNFSRWEHAWGSLVFTRRKFARAEAAGRSFSDHAKLTGEIRTFMSDAGHTAFSHLGDWLKQGFGGSEDDHDAQLASFLDDTGVSDILERHGIAPETVIFPPGSDWIECPSPDLCVDRVDYGVREISRWVEPSLAFQEPWDEQFDIDERDRLIMRDEASARTFAAGYNLLPTEHWGHPVHRLQLQLFAELVKGAVLQEPALFRGSNASLNEMLYTVDNDVLANIRQIGTLNHDLHALMLDTARAQRRVFAWSREADISRFMREVRDGGQSVRGSFPNPLEQTTPQSRYAGVCPQNIELVPVKTPADVADYRSQPSSLDFYLPPLKPRSVDPLFRDTHGQVRRLSEQDNRFAGWLGQQRAQQAQAYVARMYMAPAAARQLRGNIRMIDNDWQRRMAEEADRGRSPHFGDTLRIVGIMAVAQAPRINLF